MKSFLPILAALLCGGCVSFKKNVAAVDANYRTRVSSDTWRLGVSYTPPMTVNAGLSWEQDYRDPTAKPMQTGTAQIPVAK